MLVYTYIGLYVRMSMYVYVHNVYVDVCMCLRARVITKLKKE